MDKLNKRERIIWTVILILDLILVFMNQSTYDSGDSVLHYLYSKQAIDYPAYFMDHWAKPVFVLLSAPFAYFGWLGMQLFNALSVFFSCFMLYLLLKRHLHSSWLGVLLCFAAPQFFLVQSSGLTEPLFALFLISSIYLLYNQRWAAGLILLSFLPFVRSEGWLIAIAVIVYVLVKSQYRKLPWLALGTLVYGLIGIFYYGDFLWMFHQNPYAGQELKYGSGQWLHYVEQLPYVIGFPFYLLVFIGYFDGFWRSVQSKMNWEEFFLIYGISLGYLFAHSAFWAEGWFHSFGLNRVLLVLVPLYAWIAIRGIERIRCALPFINPKYISGFWILLLLIFPFTSNKAALDLPSSYQLEPAQQLINQLGLKIDSLNLTGPVYYGNTYIPMSLGLDIDNPKEARLIGLLYDGPAVEGSLVFWDSYFAVTDQDISSEMLAKREDLTLWKKVDCTECRSRYWIELYLVK